jgi:hydrogenase/urease accessory protein HupE
MRLKVIYIFVFFAVLVARAHEPGLSSALLSWKVDHVELALTFAVADMDNLFALDNDGDGKVSQLEFSYSKARLAATPSNAVEVTVDGQKLSPDAPSVRMDDQNNVEFLIRYAAGGGTNLIYRCAILHQLPRAHRQIATLKDRNGNVIAERLLKADSDTLSFPPTESLASAGESAPKQTFTGFLTLGIEHILTGYDHLLFLFALLLVTRQFWAALKIVTCFTIAHSITLAIATFDLFSISPRIVEPLIAATIIYVAVENIWLRREPKARWLLTFGFGLIHGFGFAGVLRELGVGRDGSSIAVPLFSFNLGVELGQIVVAAIILPFIWRFSKNPAFLSRWVPALSVLIALVGGFWFFHRVFGL